VSLTVIRRRITDLQSKGREVEFDIFADGITSALSLEMSDSLALQLKHVEEIESSCIDLDEDYDPREFTAV
jgi:hypothetical protein